MVDDINNKDNVKIEITQDKLVDLLLHAATREDIAKLASDTKIDNSRLEDKFENNNAKIIAQFKADNIELKNKVEADMAKYASEYKTDILRLENNISKIEVSLKDIILELKRSNEASEARNDRQFKDVMNLIEASEARNDRNFFKIDQRYNWILGTILAVGLALAGMIARSSHWF